MQLAGLAMAMSVVAYPTHAFDYNLSQAAQSSPKPELEMITKSQYQFPLAETFGMSQGYHGLHPGVDLRAPSALLSIVWLTGQSWRWRRCLWDMDTLSASPTMAQFRHCMPILIK